MRKYIIALILLLAVSFSSNQTKGQDFYHSYVYTPAPSGGYGLLYNWYATQDQQAGIKYGYLYNWYAATDSRNICSDGFHIPSDEEIITLSSYLDSATDIYTLGEISSIVGGKLKEVGILHWNTPNSGANNSAKLNIRGSGVRLRDGTFYAFGQYSSHWGSTLVGEAPYNFPVRFNTTKEFASFIRSNDYREEGKSLRTLKDYTILTDGQTGTYTGNDGKVYRTICIGTQEWLADNLSETKYRNGDLIPEVTDNTAWAALTTGARCSYNNDESNAFTTTNIAPAGWRVPTKSDVDALISFLGNIVPSGSYAGFSLNGFKLKKSGYTHWGNEDEPVNNGTDELGFSAVGAGWREQWSGDFWDLKFSMDMWTSTKNDASSAYTLGIFRDYAGCWSAGAILNQGYSIRLIKNDSTWSPGDAINDNDGNVYTTVKIGDQVWITSNWKCTSYNDGSPIPNVTDNTEWTLLTTPAWSVFDNNPLNK